MKYLIASLVGAVIGYITNWLAIKMLFRPHRQLKFLGLKVPFTPGLIPKERFRISRSVGQTIGEHLLTKDTIVESLCSSEVNNRLKSWVNDKVEALVCSTKTVGEKLGEVFGDKYSSFILNMENKAAGYVLNTIKKDEYKDKIIYAIKNEMLDYRVSKEFNNAVRGFVQEKYIELTKSELSIDEVLPSSFVSTLKVYIYNKNHDIAMYIKDNVKKEGVQQKLKTYISQMISANLNPMMAMFVNVDSIFEKISSAIDNYLDDEENQRNIAIIMTNTLDEALKQSINSISKGVSEEGRKNNIDAIADMLLNKVIDDKLISKSMDVVDEKLSSLVNSEEIEKQIQNAIEVMTNKIMSLKLCEVFIGKEEEIDSVIYSIVSDGYNKFIENKAADVVEMIDIPKIVEEKINSFDVAFAEQIILEIASKELSAITWLGALLGAIMGILSPVLSALY